MLRQSGGFPSMCLADMKTTAPPRVGELELAGLLTRLGASRGGHHAPLGGSRNQLGSAGVALPPSAAAPFPDRREASSPPGRRRLACTHGKGTCS
jgi:hypothetical protein